MRGETVGQLVSGERVGNSFCAEARRREPVAGEEEGEMEGLSVGGGAVGLLVSYLQ